MDVFLVIDIFKTITTVAESSTNYFKINKQLYDVERNNFHDVILMRVRT